MGKGVEVRRLNEVGSVKIISEPAGIVEFGTKLIVNSQSMYPRPFLGAVILA